MIPAQVDVRAVLLEALMELGCAVSFDKVTVKDVCRLAGVSKRTFYNHFRDKYDLAAWGYREGVASCAPVPGAGFYEEQLACLAAVAAHGAYYGHLFEDTHGADSFRRAIREINRQLYGDRIRRATGHEPDERLNFILDVYLGGLSEAYIDWWREGRPVSAELLARWATEALPESLRDYLEG